jgi:hypothetical protein
MHNRVVDGSGPPDACRNACPAALLIDPDIRQHPARSGHGMTKNVTDPQLTPKQRKAVEALLITGDVSAAAKETGVSRESLYRWLKQPVFLQAVREAEAQAIDELSRLLVRLARTAAANLEGDERSSRPSSDPSAGGGRRAGTTAATARTRHPRGPSN